MPRPHASVDNFRKEVLLTLAVAILNLGQAQKDLSECEPEILMGRGRGDFGHKKQVEISRLVREIERLSGELLREIPAS